LRFEPVGVVDASQKTKGAVVSRRRQQQEGPGRGEKLRLKKDRVAGSALAGQRGYVVGAQSPIGRTGSKCKRKEERG
jgi:hypothetical protein